MTENLRQIEMTPTLKKSFSAFNPQDYNLVEGETRSFIDPKCLQDEALKELMGCLKEWINASLCVENTRVSITDFEEDFKDGMVFKFLIEKHLKRDIITPCGDFVQSKERQLLNVDYIITVIG